jgi:benzoyl-CoA reductase/2-hydroxyglutaryl-CoA dehydratase subunit BcrC/BadD/HgdB
MNVSTKDLLDLLAKAGELDLSIFVREDDDGDYIVKFYELYTNKFDETLVINKEGQVEWCSGDNTFEYLMDTFVDMLSEKEQEKIKEQKLQELLARLTDEEKELLGVVK